MSQTSGFFEAELLPDGGFDRVYLASQFAKYFSNFISNGVFANPTNQLLVTQTTEQSMSVVVKKGTAYINGYWFESSSDEIFTVANAAGSLGRYDIIVVRYDVQERRIKLVLKQGTPSSNPQAPNIVRDSTAFELMLCKIYVAPAVTSITNSNITDMRANESVCGFVASTIQHLETQELFNQYSDIFNTWFTNLKQGVEEEGDVFRFMFNEWFDTIKGQLDGDQAANLNARINALSEVARTGNYNDLNDKPALSKVATSGSYNDLNDKPTYSRVATSGSFNDLSNKPSIPSVTDTFSSTSSAGMSGKAVSSELKTLFKKQTMQQHSGTFSGGKELTFSYTAPSGYKLFNVIPRVGTIGMQCCVANISTTKVLVGLYWPQSSLTGDYVDLDLIFVKSDYMSDIT